MCSHFGTILRISTKLRRLRFVSWSAIYQMSVYLATSVLCLTRVGRLSLVTTLHTDQSDALAVLQARRHIQLVVSAHLTSSIGLMEAPNWLLSCACMRFRAIWQGLAHLTLMSAVVAHANTTVIVSTPPPVI